MVLEEPIGRDLESSSSIGSDLSWHPRPILETEEPFRYMSTRGSNKGTVFSKNVLDSGAVSVSIISHNEIWTGDKIANMHGQKCTLYVVEDEDMFWGTDEITGESIRFDLVMSAAAVKRRGTLGQVFEMAAGVQQLRAGSSGSSRVVVDWEMNSETHDTVLYDPYNGSILSLETEEEAGNNYVDEKRVIRATWGLATFIAQTQMTRDKQHWTDDHQGSSSLTTKKGRTDGGGISISDMERKAMHSAGLSESFKDMLFKTDVVTINVCDGCGRVAFLCQGCKGFGSSPTAVRSSTVRFDVASAIRHASSNQYLTTANKSLLKK